MKLYVGRVMSAGVLVMAIAVAAQAQPPQAWSHQTGVSPYLEVSDFGGPYAAMAPDFVPPHAPVPLLLPRQVVMIVRENGFFPLGLPRQRGLTYTVAVIDGDGEDGHLVIDARNGRIVRFLPALRMGDRMDDEIAADLPIGHPPSPIPRPQVEVPGPLMSAPLPAPLESEQPSIPMASMQPPPASVPRPLALVPRHQASRSVGAQPKPTSPAAGQRPIAAAPAPVAAPEAAPAAAAPPQQSAVVQPKPAEATAPGMTTGQAPAKPAVRIMPTQPMPQAQGLD